MRRQTSSSVEGAAVNLVSRRVAVDWVGWAA